MATTHLLAAGWESELFFTLILVLIGIASFVKGVIERLVKSRGDGSPPPPISETIRRELRRVLDAGQRSPPLAPRAPAEEDEPATSMPGEVEPPPPAPPVAWRPAPPSGPAHPLMTRFEEMGASTAELIATPLSRPRAAGRFLASTSTVGSAPAKRSEAEERLARLIGGRGRPLRRAIIAREILEPRCRRPLRGSRR